jgi:hypothetical protein
MHMHRDHRRFASSFAVGLLSVAVGVLTFAVVAAQQNPFLGKWNLTGTGADAAYVGWLEITDEGGQLGGMFLNRGGAPAKLAGAKVENGELVFQAAARRGGPGPEGRARVQGATLTGTITTLATATAPARTVAFSAARPPVFPASDANAAHTFGAPVELFDGKTMDAFTLVNPARPWTVSDGLAWNAPPAETPTGRYIGSNLISKQKFFDYRIHAEYKLDNEAHSGIYFRGRYEMQVLGDMGVALSPISHMAVYGRIAPLVNASIPDNEWNIMDGVIVGNRITVTLNGKKVHDNTLLQGITGNAVDANELEPGPIMIVGNDGRIWYRRITVTPITR